MPHRPTRRSARSAAGAIVAILCGGLLLGTVSGGFAGPAATGAAPSSASSAAVRSDVSEAVDALAEVRAERSGLPRFSSERSDALSASGPGKGGTEEESTETEGTTDLVGGGAAADAEGSAEDSGGAAEEETEAWVDSEAGRVELLVYFEDAGVDPAAQGDPELVAEDLQQDAETHWARIDRSLEALERSDEIEVLNRFWVTSAVLVSADASDRTIAKLASLPGATDVTPNYTVEPLEDFEAVPEPADENGGDPAPADASPRAAEVTYGIEKINADRAWVDFSARGQGVRVAVLDTGIDATHPELAPRMVGRDSGDPSYPGGWINFDRNGVPIVTKPTDPGSHGTHVAGTIVGGDASGTGIGVAPEAELMGANVLSGGGSTAKILAALEWVISPYHAADKNRPAGRAADVINMSLGSDHGDLELDLAHAIRNVRDAGIFPAIAIGNEAGITSSPGDFFDSVAVGMTDEADAVSPGSSGGVVSWKPGQVPAEFGWPESYVKPDISAPGVSVLSSLPGGKYGSSTGTSMATPHVAGAVALIRSAQGGRDVDQIESALERTAWHPSAGQAPDIRYGHGRIDVHAALVDLLGQPANMQTPGISGRVVDAKTGAPVAGATISYADRGETWVTDADGRFTAHLVPGEYTLTVQRFGYESAKTAALTVRASGLVDTEVRLAPITVGSISGTVLDNETGAPIAGATVTVLGQPIQATTDAKGAYRFDKLPVGSYALRATAPAGLGLVDSTSAPAAVSAALETKVNFRLAAQQRVLLLGEGTEHTAALLADNGFSVTSAAQPPAPADIGAYDAVLWDTPAAPLEAPQLQAVIAEAQKQDTGIVWLDLGSSDTSGIANLASRTGDPVGRGAENDRTASLVGYRITHSPNGGPIHPILAGGALSPEALTTGAVVAQNTAASGPKPAAWFERLASETGAVALADTVVQHPNPENPGAPVTTRKGVGIAVYERETGRQAFLSLHGSSPAVGARNWSIASQQLLLNAVSWTAPAAAQAPAPEIVLPTPPEIPTGPKNPKPNPGSSDPTPRPTGGSTTAPTVVNPQPAPPQQQASQSRRAPSGQAASKPKQKPDAPFASDRQLQAADDGGITVRIDGGIAHVKIPDSKPGDWFFLHVYPSKTAVDWIRVNNDGELRIDIGKLHGGTYRFAFTDVDGEFVGWVEVKVPGSAQAAGGSDLPDAAPTVVDLNGEGAQGGGFSLSTAEQLMLLGAALLFFAAAGVVLFASGRGKPAAAPAAGVAGAAGASAGPAGSAG